MDTTTVPSNILATIAYPTLPILQFAPTYPRGIAGGITFQLAPAGMTYPYTVAAGSYKVTCIEYNDASFNSTVISPLTKLYTLNPECDIAIHEETFSSTVTSGQISGLKDGAYYRVFITTIPAASEAARFGNNPNAITPRNSYPVFPIVPTSGASLQPQLSAAEASALANLEQSNPAYLIYAVDDYNPLITVQYLEKVLRTKNGLPYIHNLVRATVSIPELSSNEIPFNVGYKSGYSYFKGDYYVNEQLQLTAANGGVAYNTLYNITLKMYYEDGTSKTVAPVQVRSSVNPSESVSKMYPQFTTLDDAKLFLASSEKARLTVGAPEASVADHFTAAAVADRLGRYRAMLGWASDDATKGYSEIATGFTTKIDDPGFLVDGAGQVTYTVNPTDHYKYFYANLWLAADTDDLTKAKDMRAFINGIEKLEAFQSTTIKNSQFASSPHFNIKYPRVLYLPNLAESDIVRIDSGAFSLFTYSTACLLFKNQIVLPYIIVGQNISYSVPNWALTMTIHFVGKSATTQTTNGVTRVISPDIFMIGKALIPNAPVLVRDDMTLTLPANIEYIPGSYFRNSNVTSFIVPPGSPNMFVGANALPVSASLQINNAPYVSGTVRVSSNTVTPGTTISQIYDTFASLFYSYDLNISGGDALTVKPGVTQIDQGFLRTSNLTKLNIDPSVTVELLIKEGSLPNNTIICVSGNSQWYDSASPNGQTGISDMIYTNTTTDLKYRDGLFYIKSGQYYTGYWLPLGIQPTSIIIPSGVRSVPQHWFPYAISITLPDESFEIGNKSFSQTPGDSYFYYRASNARIYQSGITYRYIYNYSSNLQVYNIPSTLTGDIIIPSLSSYALSDYMFSKDNSTALRYDNTSPALGFEDIPLVNSITFSGRYPPTFTRTQLKNTQSYRFGDTSIMWINSHTGPATFDPAYAFDTVEGIADMMEFGDNIFDVGGAYTGGLAIRTVRFARGSAVKQIGTRAFYGCANLATFSIPMSRVGASAFYGNISLGNITFNNVDEIGTNAFYGCSSIPTLSISSSGNLTIRAGAFENCTGIMNVVISVGGNLTIEQNAFKGCTNVSQVSLTVGGSTSLGANIFQGCTGMASFAITSSSSLTLLPSVFAGCTSLQTLSMSGLSGSVSASLFNGISTLKTVMFAFQSGANASVESFTGLTQLETVSLTGGVTSIADDMFSGCSALKTVTINGAVSSIPVNSFAGCASLITITVNYSGAASCHEAFSNLTALKTVTFTGAAGASLMLISNAFSGCSALENLTISLPITSSLMTAFNGCAALKGMSLQFTASAGATFGSDLANMPAMTTVSILGGVSVTSNVFLQGSTGVRNLTINGTLDGTIDAATFASLENITVKYGAANAAIPPYAFMNNTSLKSATFLSGLKEIGDGAFYNCANLRSLTLPAGLEDINNYAFARSGISGEITIPASVTQLGESYFALCPNLTKVTYECPVLMFNDPTQFTTSSLNAINVPTNMTLDISGTIKLLIGAGTTSFSYVSLPDNTSTTVPMTSLKKSVLKTKHTERLTSLRTCLSNLHLIYNALGTAYTAATNATDATAIANRIATMGSLIGDITDTIGDAENIYDTITLAADLSEHIISTNGGSPAYNFKTEYITIADSVGTVSTLNTATSALNAAIAVDETIVGPLYTTIPPAQLDLYHIKPEEYLLPSHISVTLPPTQIAKINGLNAIQAEGGTLYFKVEEDNATILLRDNTVLSVSGRIRVDLNAHLGSQHAEILGYFWQNISSTDSDNIVDYVFNGPECSIINLSNQRSNSINITSTNVVIHDCAMKYLTDSNVTITSTNLKIYDNAFGMWKSSQLHITTGSLIVGKDIFLGSEDVMVYSNQQMVNKPIIRLVNMSDKTLHDISGIISSELGIDPVDTRNAKVGTYIPEEAGSRIRGYPTISFQRLSTLQHYTLIAQPEDWFWCMRLNPQKRTSIAVSNYTANFSAGSQKYDYLPTSYQYDAQGQLMPEENFGLSHAFAPAMFSFNGKKWARSTTTSTGAGVIVRAIFTNHQPYASNARQEQNGIKLLINMAKEIAISLAFAAISAAIPAAGIFVAGTWMARAFQVARAVALTAGEMAATEFATRGIPIGESVRFGGGSARVIWGPIKVGAVHGMRATIVDQADNVLADVVKLGAKTNVTTVVARTSSGLISSPGELKIIAGEMDNLFSFAMAAKAAAPDPTAITQKVSRVTAPTIPQGSVVTKTQLSSGKHVANTTKVTIMMKSTVGKGKTVATKARLHKGRKLAPTKNIPPTIKQIVPPPAVQTLEKRISNLFHKTINGTVDVLQSYATSKLIDMALEELLTLIMEPLYDGNTAKHIKKIMGAFSFIKGSSAGLRSGSRSVTIDDVIMDLTTYVYKVLLNEVSSIAGMTEYLKEMETLDSTYNTRDVTLHQLAVYNALEWQTMNSRGETGNVLLEDDIVNAAKRAVEVRTPPYLIPQSVPSQYTTAPEDRLQHYILRGTVYVHPPEEAQKYISSTEDPGVYNNPCRVLTVATPLHLNPQYMWRSTFCGYTRSADNPRTSGFDDNTILVLNAQLDEVYLGNRVVNYVELSSNEEPNTVLSGVTNVNITIPEGITDIVDHAYCSTDGTDGNLPFSINTLGLPASLKTIGKRAFYRTNLNSAVIPKGIERIASEAFRNSGLTNVTFLDSMTTAENLTNVSVTLKSTSKLSAGFGRALTITDSLVSYSRQGGAGVTNQATPYVNLNMITTFTITNVSKLSVTWDGYYADYTGTMTINIYENNSNFTVDGEKLIFRNTGQVSMSVSGITRENVYISRTGELLHSSGVLPAFGKSFPKDYNADLPYKQFVIFTNPAAGSVLTFPSIPTALFGEASASSITPRSRSVRTTGVIIEDNAFSDNNITTVTLPPDIISIGANVFMNCPLEEIIFTGPPPPLESIDPTFFEQIPPNTVITVPPVYMAQVQALFESAPVQPPNLTFNVYTNPEGPICFLGNAPVLTPSGYKRMDSLRTGDLVTTTDGRQVPIQNVKTMRCAATDSSRPYVIPRGMFGAQKDLMISPRHRIAAGERGMVEARALGLAQAKMRGYITYYNLELPSWKSDNMIIAGVEVESLAPVQRRVVTMSQFRHIVQRTYGSDIPQHIMAKIIRTCKFLPNGDVEIPCMKHKA